MLERNDGHRSVWDRAELTTLIAGVLRGLRIEQLPDVSVIGGGASLTTTCGDATIKTVSLSYGAERYLHFVGVHGRINPDEALALVELFACLLDVPPSTEFRRGPDRGTLIIRCDAASEHALQNRICLLSDGDSLAAALVTALQPH